jgi:CheY-like chemotaxis protein
MPQTRPRILVVEDDDATRNLIGAGLDSLGAELRCVADGAQALSVVKDFDPQLILLDIMMPRMNGFQFLRRYRQICENPAAVIVLSAKNDQTDRFWAERLGVVNYVVKPFRLVDLRRVVAEQLERVALSAPAARP